jgi:hypothetical protein
MGCEKESNGELINLALFCHNPEGTSEGKGLTDFGGTMQPKLVSTQGTPRRIMRQPR